MDSECERMMVLRNEELTITIIIITIINCCCSQSRHHYYNIIIFVFFSHIGAPRFLCVLSVKCAALQSFIKKLNRSRSSVIFWWVIVISLGISANLRENWVKVISFWLLIGWQNFFNLLPSVLELTRKQNMISANDKP